MTNEEASIIIGNIPINGDECYSIPEYQQAKARAIQSLEAWEKVKNDICEIDWYGDDAFWDGVNLVSDIIDEHLSEVSE